MASGFLQETKYQEEVKNRLKSFRQAPLDINEAIKYAELGFTFESGKLVCKDCNLVLSGADAKKDRLATIHEREHPECPFLSLYMSHRIFVRESKIRSSRKKKLDTLNRLGRPSHGWFSLENITESTGLRRSNQTVTVNKIPVDNLRGFKGHQDSAKPQGSASFDSSNGSTSTLRPGSSSTSASVKERRTTSIWTRMTSFSSKHKMRKPMKPLNMEMARKFSPEETEQRSNTVSLNMLHETDLSTAGDIVPNTRSFRTVNPETTEAPSSTVLQPDQEAIDRVTFMVGCDDVDAAVVGLSSVSFQEIPPASPICGSPENPMTREDSRLESLGVATVAVVAAQTGFYRNPCDPQGVARCAFCNSTSDLHKSSVEELLNRRSHYSDCPVRRLTADENIPLAHCTGPTPSPPISWFRSVSVPDVSSLVHSTPRARPRIRLQSNVQEAEVIVEEQGVEVPFDRNDSVATSSGIASLDQNESVISLQAQVQNLSSQLQRLRDDLERLQHAQERNQEFQQQTNSYLANILSLLLSQSTSSQA